jgi:hypothetical protein
MHFELDKVAKPIIVSGSDVSRCIQGYQDIRFSTVTLLLIKSPRATGRIVGAIVRNILSEYMQGWPGSIIFVWKSISICYKHFSTSHNNDVAIIIFRLSRLTNREAFSTPTSPTPPPLSSPQRQTLEPQDLHPLVKSTMCGPLG